MSLRIEDVRVGDHIGCHAWAHPFVVVSVDANADGPIVVFQRWDGQRHATLRIGAKDWDKAQRAAGKFYRYDPTTPCPHCGRKDNCG